MQRLRGHLSALDDKLKAHPLTQKRADKCEEIAMSKLQLQVVIDELADAKASLEAKLRMRDDAADALKMDLAEKDSE